MFRRITQLCAWVLVACTLSAAAPDEGMWLFNAVPRDKLKARYGFDPSQQWLDHLRLSSVRFNNGGSGSFVSANGLTFTNHHVGAECVHNLSKAGEDRIKIGYYAKTQAEEVKCPDLELNVLRDIEDVTGKVNAAVKDDMSAAAAGQAQRAAMSQIEKECNQSSGLRCDVVTFYSGGAYHLYKYKKYTDVRLVFAPEFDAAFFGGDPDNFTYPRYDLDITFFRIYENDKPVHLDNYLKWSAAGVKEGDLVFVSGHPGSTGRLNTVAQLGYLRDLQYPFNLWSLKRRAQMLHKFGDASEENARVAQELLFGIENSLKAYIGYNAGLTDQSVIDKLTAAERQLQASVNSDPTRQQKFGKAWDEIAHAVEVNRTIFLPLTFFERRAGLRGTLAGFARDLVRAASEKAKPNGERLREYRDSNLTSLEQGLFSEAPVYKSLETAVMAESFEELQQKMPDHQITQKILNGKSPAEAAKALIEGTKLDDVAVRKQLYAGGAAAIEASKDPLIVLMRDVDPEARVARKRFDDEVDSVVRRNGALIANARFAQGGTSMPPDATFTLRLSYGAVKGYEENGKHVPYFTTMGGAFKHAAEHDNKPPYQLPDTWMKSKAKLRLPTALNFVSTPDIIGGNSGSPVVNRNNEVVGIIFDGNIQSLPWNFMYDDRVGRSVSVDSRGIQEALRHIYGATALADELAGRGAAGAKAPPKAVKAGGKAKAKKKAAGA